MVTGRTVAIYLLMLVMIRLLGRRTIGNLTTFDMLIVLIMGDLAGDAIYGDASIGDAVVAVLSISALHYANSWLAYRRPGFARLVEGTPTAIVRDGRLDGDGLRRERMSEQEALTELRLAGIEEVAEVKLAQVESDGKVSVILQEWAQPLQKRDRVDLAK